ncbi:hypothetical protein M9H77_31301 [Catharanthus roseus]|uniref:Uncharacterized protein n=1 Tax=Catharanthus roseus TaxID=4058 RepID=A0ACC0A016_CATRO|nr:hypothetical protein M9H77_31301 [Catharanthus roseus]
MASSSSSSAIKVVLQSIDGKIFEVDEAVAKKSVTIEHLIEDRLTRTGPDVDYYKLVVTQPPSGENDVELKAFVSELVNDDEKTLLSLACENVLDMINHKDSTHIHIILNISPKFTPEEEERMRIANLWAFN